MMTAQECLSAKPKESSEGDGSLVYKGTLTVPMVWVLVYMNSIGVFVCHNLWDVADGQVKWSANCLRVCWWSFAN